jgi:outer membrane protein assembly factor BamB
MHCGFGYEHSPSVLIEKNGLLFFGTRSGVVYCIDPRKQTIEWAHKIDNSMVNTLNIVGKKKLVAATMDGKVTLLNVR